MGGKLLIVNTRHRLKEEERERMNGFIYFRKLLSTLRPCHNFKRKNIVFIVNEIIDKQVINSL